ncbi:MULTISPECIES: SigE family RNA polymerase sigma factor [Glycomyces]|uniref:RNA polymerase sigma24 factor n=2 Tax=Glycomyces TaxID=58113 RepID=A0A9W6GDX5_9ACTN|nr:MULTISPECIES: SigE family RNA polymerase sigma factor [Glycomyces]MDA1366625.1 SigE family RNA polymerase sigma factor [Glycomyces algeriensis]MDN3239994.1 SigE family RNA polymerase sigma factor [Glycomyces tritici]MDR7352282.1 RNA polymerase sigma-70 factor (sigma-E family) [Glycomyces algeriensis]GLI45017.1 RNA polymerase sigma24 factor [Glycomyces algeriensis]
MKTEEQQEAEFRSFAIAQRDSLRRYAYLLCGDWFEADDIVQKALTKMFAAWRRIEPGGASAYVRKIVTNVYISHRRLAWVRRERTSPELPVQEIDRPQEAVDVRMELEAALNLLPARQRATLVLRYWEQLSVEETATAMSCSTGTVKSQSAKGLRKLKELLNDSRVLARV